MRDEAGLAAVGMPLALGRGIRQGEAAIAFELVVVAFKPRGDATLALLDAVAYLAVVVGEAGPWHGGRAPQRLRKLRDDDRFAALLFADRHLHAARCAHGARRILGGDALLPAGA